MVIQFTIGNFLSFKEQSILSLAVSALKEVQVPAEDIIFSVGTAGLSLMKSAVVYGANAGIENIEKIDNTIGQYAYAVR